MACLGLEPGAAGLKAQTNPLRFGGTHLIIQYYNIILDPTDGFRANSFPENFAGI